MSDVAGGFDFRILGEWSDGAYVIRISGDVDLANRPALSAELELVPQSVTIDLAECTYFGSSAAAVLVAAASNGAEITLRRVPNNVKRVLDISGIASMFRYED